MFAFTPLAFLSGCNSQEKLNSYMINLTYDAVNHTANVSSSFEYINLSSNALSSIDFHLYPNAFSKAGEGMVVDSASFSKAYPNGASFGGIEISKVLVNGIEGEYSLSNPADTLATVLLDEQLFPNDTVKIEFDFSLTLPNVNHRFGYGDNFVNFANFYPIAAVYKDGEGFVKDAYISNGDPFFSDVANYSLSISYPKTFKLAASGDKMRTIENGEYLTTTFVSNKVRDVAFVLSDKFEKLNKKVGDVEVEYYYCLDTQPSASLETAVRAMQFYSDSFGDYPYSSLAVVETGFVHGGMEYPRLIMISDAVKGEDVHYVIAHEVAHQWWYGVVGNDEFNEAWIDESLTEFSTALFFEHYSEYGINYLQLIDAANSNYKFFLKTYEKLLGDVDTSMARALDEFDTQPEYVNNIYTRGVVMYDALRQDIGSKKLLKVLKGYYKQFAYQNVSKEQFIDYFSRAGGRKLNGFFESWLEGKVLFVVEG